MTYEDAGIAKREFLYFPNKLKNVKAHFATFFEAFSKDLEKSAGIASALVGETDAFTIQVLGRTFVAEMSASVKGSEVYGVVDFYEEHASTRRHVDSFYISGRGQVMDLSERVICEVHDWTDVQGLYVLNLLHLGLSKPVNRFPAALI